MVAQTQTQAAPDVDDQTTYGKRIKALEGTTDQLDTALGDAIERVEKLEKAQKEAPKSGKSGKSDAKHEDHESRLAQLEHKFGHFLHNVVHPSADNPPQGVDSQGLPKVV